MRPAVLFFVFGLALALLGGCKDKAPSTPLAEPGPVQTLEGGLTYQQLALGQGDVAQKGDKVSVHYTGRLLDGTKFDSSVDRNKPFSFRLGAGHVVKGWDLGIAGMTEGEKRRLTLPPELGYGSQAVGPIPANATLVFEVELLEVN